MRNTAELISQALSLLARPGELPNERTDEQLAEALNLPKHHFAVLRVITEGQSLQKVAAETGRSLASVKAILGTVFLDLGITSATEAACVIGQVRLVADHLLAIASDMDSWGHAQMHKQQETPEGRMVGYSACGHDTGPVAVFLHGTITCRHPPTRWVRFMLERGWSVIAVDRPGFGETSSAKTPDADMHAVVAAQV